MKNVLTDKEARDLIKKLKLIKVDPIKWLTFYLNEENGEKWVEDRPHSEYHGGGAPRLQLINKFPWE